MFELDGVAVGCLKTKSRKKLTLPLLDAGETSCAGTSPREIWVARDMNVSTPTCKVPDILLSPRGKNESQQESYVDSHALLR